MLHFKLIFFSLLLHTTLGFVSISKYNLFVISSGHRHGADNEQTSQLLEDHHHHAVKEQPHQQPKDHAKVARTLVHKSNWAGTGTISTEPDIKGYPMVNIISISDSGKGEQSTGHIYFYLTLLDFTAKDIKEDNKITFMISDEQDLACSKTNGTDPMEPTCARVIISGKVVEIANNTNEYKKAEAAFVSRHPAALRWIAAHNFFLCTIDISSILVLDWYGGPHNVTPEDYYKVPPE